MNNIEKIDEIAERCLDDLNNYVAPPKEIIESAILAALDAVLGAEPSEGMLEAGRGSRPYIDDDDDDLTDRNSASTWNAMTAALRSELKL